jgi:osmotically-inducible protein OsmY
MVSSLGLAGCSNRDAAKPSGKPVDKTVTPDNTGVNQRDRAGETITPPDQQENAGDLAITQQLRKDIVEDDAMSFDAKNIKIITSGAVVTLRGPVESQVEKAALEAKARRIPGVASVDNQLEVVSPP